MQIHIGQRGAINPLIEMLESSDLQLREMSTFALGRLAQVIIISSHYLSILWELIS
jgi:HEAT repeat protein